ncbi:MAG: hypothetical protein QG557_787, partial [Pseudomonadota bacterium]|nr:hypothetical protein [Pseudomonadota bacterium]
MAKEDQIEMEGKVID